MSTDLEPRLTEQQRQAVEEFRQRHRTALLALLFTDVEGSTALRSEMGELPASALLENHGKVIREVLAEFADAQEISTAGDSFGAAFPTAQAAVAAASQIQLTLRSEPWPGPSIRVRIGIHTGSSQERAGNYFGPDVNRAAAEAEAA